MRVSILNTYASLLCRSTTKMVSRRLFHLGTLILFFVFSTSATAQDCYESSVVRPSPFMGNNGEIFKLADGSLWEVKYEYEYMYEYYPSVIVCPQRGKLIVNKKSLNVALVSAGRASQKRPAQPAATPGKWEIYEETNLEG